MNTAPNRRASDNASSPPGTSPTRRFSDMLKESSGSDGGSGGGGGGGSITVDSTLSVSSTNPVQNKVVTDGFIRTGELLAAKADKMEFVSVLSSTPTITVQDNKFYLCDGTQTSLTIPIIEATEPPSFIVRFTSGATPTVLTITDQIVMPDGFETDANKTYEINVVRWYATVQEWPYTAGGAA